MDRGIASGSASEVADSVNKQAQNVADGDKSKQEPQIFSLEVLNIIKSSQNQHGLRHADYQRYRQYCTRRVRRIRKSLKFLHGKKFQKKTIEPATITDAKFLLLVLVKAERSWSYAMQLKDDAAGEEGARKRFHMHRKLKKAAKWATLLETLCAARTDKRSTLEAEAYAAWMRGNEVLEREVWPEALANFIKARTIYDQLSKVADTDTQDLYRQRVEEIEPSIRYCNYNLKEKRGGVSDEMLDMKMEHKGVGLDLLQSKLDSVIAESLQKQSETMREVVWRGKKIPVKGERVRVAILNTQEVTYELERCKSKQETASAAAGDLLEVYDRLFVAYNDALNLIRDEISGSSSGKQKNKAQRSEKDQESLNALKQYLSSLKLTKTLERNQLMGDSMERRLTGRVAESTEGTKKRTKPDDLVRIYEIIIQNLTELAEMEPAEDKEAEKQHAARILSFKALRCFYMGLSYAESSKWPEARALYDRAAEQIQFARSHHESCKAPDMQQITKLDQVELQLRGKRCEAHAQEFLDTTVKAKLGEKKEPVTSTDKEAQSVTLFSKLNDFDYVLNHFDLNSAHSAIISFPPDFEPVQCKPTLFDLALTECHFPDLEARKKSKGGWGWGGLFSRS